MKIQEHELTKDRICKNCGMIKEDLGFDGGCQKNPNFQIVHEFWDKVFPKISQLDLTELLEARIKMFSILQSKDQEKEKALEEYKKELREKVETNQDFGRNQTINKILSILETY